MLERLKEIWLDAKQMRDERGLTLIELLVVVVILGIIAAIAVVAIGGLIENSRKDAQVSNAKQLVSAAKLKVAADAAGIKKGDTLYFIGDTSTGADANSLDEYIDSMKDPMNSDKPYKEAFVTIDQQTNGKFTYTVTMTGSNDKKYFAGESSSDLKRSAIQ
ncbi:type II secretion system protein [Exiguobacterium oxidotolerans]|uniref:Type IV pilin N-term methylation site GFxxxE n=1 Tax=Exiguobacterium oxidotolerans TaxID=223958 RepID=A0A653IB95_9BACL|nr:prepilin-type N-terminal cleavage/methylation domain-containing protein [Exiguobacterium oxidotolerans]VWX36347.1 Type IV pilin N-term methylation site GFxxxE [Exiguobacterium oxidotolerans]